MNNSFQKIACESFFKKGHGKLLKPCASVNFGMFKKFKLFEKNLGIADRSVRIFLRYAHSYLFTGVGFYLRCLTGYLLSDFYCLQPPHVELAWYTLYSASTPAKKKSAKREPTLFFLYPKLRLFFPSAPARVPSSL